MNATHFTLFYIYILNYGFYYYFYQIFFECQLSNILFASLFWVFKFQVGGGGVSRLD